MKSIDFSDFYLETATLELRYEPALIIWDRVGSVWVEVKNKYPDLISQEISPNATLFRYKDKYELGIYIDRLLLQTISDDKWPEEFLDIATFFIKTAVSILGISEFKRVGFRVIYNKEIKENLALELFHSLGLVQAPPKSEYFGINGKIKLPSYKVNWESDTLGATLHLQFVEQKINIGLPFNVLRYVEKRVIERNLLSIDVDYFTKVGARSSQFNIREWVSQAIQVIRRDLNSFLKKP